MPGSVFHMATFIWKQNDLRGESLNRHQMTLITKVFGILNVGEFMSRMSNPLLVPTWDGKTRAWVKPEQLVRIHKESCIFGPLAALFGREVQQFLMVNPNAKIILMTEFQHSVDSGRVSLGTSRINWEVAT